MTTAGVQEVAIICNYISIDHVSQGEEVLVLGPIWGHATTNGSLQGCDKVGKVPALIIRSRLHQQGLRLVLR